MYTVFGTLCMLHLKRNTVNVVLAEKRWLFKSLPKLAKYFFKHVQWAEKGKKFSQPYPTYSSFKCIFEAFGAYYPHIKLSPICFPWTHLDQSNFHMLCPLLVDTSVSHKPFKGKGCFCLHLCISNLALCLEHLSTS